MIVVNCPCGHSMRAPEKFAGKRVTCAKCKTPVEVPVFVPAVAAVPDLEPEPIPVQIVVTAPERRAKRLLPAWNGDAVLRWFLLIVFLVDQVIILNLWISHGTHEARSAHLVQTQQVSVVDSAGRERATIGVGRNGDVAFDLQGLKASRGSLIPITRIRLMVNSEGEPCVFLFREPKVGEGKGEIAVSLSQIGEKAVIAVHDEDGRIKDGIGAGAR